VDQAEKINSVLAKFRITVPPKAHDKRNAKSDSCHFQDQTERGRFKLALKIVFVQEIKYDGYNDKIDERKPEHTIPEFSNGTAAG
jgi:hypothetical protein